MLIIRRSNCINTVSGIVLGTAVAQWLRYCATNRKVTGSIPGGVSGFFIDIKSFRSHYDPGVDSASNKNEYQEYFLRGKGGRWVRLATYHHPVLLSCNLGTLTSWNPLGHSRPVTGMLYIYIHTHTHTHITINPLNAELNYICHLLALLGAHHIFHVSRIRVNRPHFLMANRHFLSRYISFIYFTAFHITMFFLIILTFRRLMSIIVDVPHR